MHKAGVPENVLQLLLGPGPIVGAKITSDPRVNGVCFTGSTAVAQTINRSMSGTIEPDATFIAETGGLNAMIVDSTALPEQAIKDIVVSAFQSAGQRCSALRMLYLQKDIAEEFLEMLYGALDQLTIGQPWEFSMDVGPAINQSAHREITDYIDAAEQRGDILKRLPVSEGGFFVAPSVIQVSGIRDLEKEIFGPVLHVATFGANEIDQIVFDVNASGYGLTFGLHTRMDDRVEQVTSQLNVGNIYVNRNQIGAIVGSQPFGGEGMSGTGPKAGGPRYVPRFTRKALPGHAIISGTHVDPVKVQPQLSSLSVQQLGKLSTIDLPGPTGESNRLSVFPRGTILCLGPSAKDAKDQYDIAMSNGCKALMVAPGASGDNAVDGFLPREHIRTLNNIDGVALWSTTDDLKACRKALASREGAIIPLLASPDMADQCVLERHICIDTTAAGGNATLLAGE